MTERTKSTWVWLVLLINGKYSMYAFTNIFWLQQYHLVAGQKMSHCNAEDAHEKIWEVSINIARETTTSSIIYILHNINLT